MAASQARQVRLVGAAIAAVSGPVVIAGLFVHWYSRSALCLDVPCLPLVRDGWDSLGTGKLAILAAGILGPVPLLAEALPRPARPWLRALAGLAALAGALVVVHRIAGKAPGGAIPVEGFVRQLSSSLAAGPWITLVACLGVAGGGLLAGIGPEFFAPARTARISMVVIWSACLVGAVALWLPWVAPAGDFLTLFGPDGQSASASAWDGLHTLATLLLLGLLATSGGAAIGGWFRWRAVFLAMAAAGWLLAAFAAVGELRPTTPSLELLPGAPAHRFGYWLFLGCAGVIVLTGVASAMSGPDGLEDHGLPAELRA